MDKIQRENELNSLRTEVKVTKVRDFFEKRAKEYDKERNYLYHLIKTANTLTKEQSIFLRQAEFELRRLMNSPEKGIWVSEEGLNAKRALMMACEGASPDLDDWQMTFGNLASHLDPGWQKLERFSDIKAICHQDLTDKTLLRIAKEVPQNMLLAAKKTAQGGALKYASEHNTSIARVIKDECTRLELYSGSLSTKMRSQRLKLLALKLDAVIGDDDAKQSVRKLSIALNDRGLQLSIEPEGTLNKLKVWINRELGSSS